MSVSDDKEEQCSTSDAPVDSAPPPSPADDHPPIQRRPAQRSRLREKAPEILFEAASVVFAVLLALTLNEWRDDQARARRADEARLGILAEIQSNLDELRANEAENQSNLDRLQAALAALEDDSEDSPESGQALSIDYSLSILSSSAWETARVTGVLHDLDFAWVSDMSKLYELQGIFVERQADLVDYITRVDLRDDEQAAAVLTQLRNRMRTVLVFQDGLFTEYEAVLAVTISDDDP